MKPARLWLGLAACLTAVEIGWPGAVCAAQEADGPLTVGEIPVTSTELYDPGAAMPDAGVQGPEIRAQETDNGAQVPDAAEQVPQRLVPFIDAIVQAPDPSAAVEAYTRAVGSVGDEPILEDAYLHRMVELGVPEKAAAQARDLVQRDPQHGLAWAVLAHSEASRGRMENALDAIARAAGLEPDDEFVQRTAGSLLAWYDTHRDRVQIPDALRDALEQIRTAFADKPAFADAYRRARAVYDREAVAPPVAPEPAIEPLGPIEEVPAVVPLYPEYPYPTYRTYVESRRYVRYYQPYVPYPIYGGVYYGDYYGTSCWPGGVGVTVDWRRNYHHYDRNRHGYRRYPNYGRDDGARDHRPPDLVSGPRALQPQRIAANGPARVAVNRQPTNRVGQLGRGVITLNGPYRITNTARVVPTARRAPNAAVPDVTNQRAGTSGSSGGRSPGRPAVTPSPQRSPIERLTRPAQPAPTGSINRPATAPPSRPAGSVNRPATAPPSRPAGSINRPPTAPQPRPAASISRPPPAPQARPSSSVSRPTPQAAAPRPISRPSSPPPQPQPQRRTR